MLDGHGPLIGREDELAAASGLLAPGGPWAVQLVGPAGIGKSRLLRELAARAERAGYLVLQGRAAEFEGEVPFGIFRHAIDDRVWALSPAERAALAGHDARELAHVLPAFGRVAGDAPSGPERHRSYDAVRRLLTEMARERPLLLVLDDAGWADPASVELLVHLLARPPRGRVRLALALRTQRVPARLEHALAAAVREHESLRLDVPPLGDEHCLALLDGAVPRDVATRIGKQSGGAPFFLLALARAHVQDGPGTARRACDVAGVPPAVRSALAGELRALSAEERSLLRGAAVVGDPCDLRVAAAAAGAPSATLPGLADRLVATGMLHRGGGRDVVAFRHPVVRATVLADAGAEWRAAAHGRVAAHLAEQGAELAARAPHVERSAAPGDDAAIALLRRAGDAAAGRAPEQAARFYASAATLVTASSGGTPRRIELRLAEAGALVGAGLLGRGRAAFGVALELLAPDDPARPVVDASCAAVEHLLGRHRDAHARLTAARGAVPPASEAAVLLDLELAATAGYEVRPVEMMDRARAALAQADRLGLAPLGAVAAGQIGLATYFLGEPPDAVLDDAAARFARLTDEELATRLDLGLWLGWTEAVLERHEASLATTDRVLRVARATGQAATLLVTQTAATWSLLRLGRLDEAEAMIDDAVATGRLAPHLFLSVSVGQLALLRVAQGRLREAVEAGEESRRLAADADPGLIRSMSGFYGAVPLLEAGRPEDARRVLLEAFGDVEQPRTSRSGHVPACEVLVRAAIAAGDLGQAGLWAARGEVAGHGGMLPAEDAHAQRAIAEHALAGGDPDRAAAVAAAAAERSLRHRLPIEAGRCETVAGRALAAAGRRDDAVLVLERATARLTAVGAAGWAADADRELRRLGRRRRTSSAGGGALTDRERQVAELVRSGLGNRQIAARLYVSEKTVERTLSTTFAKLGVRNRTALATAIGDAGAPPSAD